MSFFPESPNHHQRYLELLLQWVPNCCTHHTGSQHILLHLYQGAVDDLRETHARFRTIPVFLEDSYWSEHFFNPILAILALSDSQGLECLEFAGEVNLECAGRILEIVTAVKSQPVAFSGLFIDIANATTGDFGPTDLAVILKSIEKFTTSSDEEYPSFLLLPMVSGLQKLQQLAVGLDADAPAWGKDPSVLEHGIAESQRICSLLQAKYAATLISSTAQLRLLSCTRSAAVVQPAMGWLRMHEPL
jgi:hypothetical protein